MKTTSICIAIFLLLCMVSVQAEDQEKSTSTKEKSAEVTTQIATTSDGRKVILKSDGTWEYLKETPPTVEVPIEHEASTKSGSPAVETPNPEVTPVPNPQTTAAVPKENPTAVPAPEEHPTIAPVPENPPTAVPVPPNDVQKGTLSFDAGVAVAGEVKPIAGGTFYLLDNDLNNILQTSGFKPDKRLSLLSTFSTSYYGSSLGVGRSAKTFARAMESIKPHIVATATSDSNGKGEFSSIVPGNYSLMNVSVIYLNTGSLSDRRAILWDVRIQVRPGQNSIGLDEKNAVP